jgi:hypothetical protein
LTKFPYLTSRVQGANRMRPPEEGPHEWKIVADAVYQHSKMSCVLQLIHVRMETIFCEV